MIPFKYYIYIYCRYIKLSIEYKIRSIRKWILKPRSERYRYFNPENEKYVIDSPVMSVLSIATDNIDKIYYIINIFNINKSFLIRFNIVFNNIFIFFQIHLIGYFENFGLKFECLTFY